MVHAPKSKSFVNIIVLSNNSNNMKTKKHISQEK